VNKVAPLFGTYAGWMSAPQGDLAGKFNWIVQRLKGFKIADPIKTTEIALSKPDSYPIASGVGASILGFGIREVGKAVGIGAVSRMGSAAMKFGGAAAVNGLVAAYIYEAVNNPHPSMSGSNGSGASTYNVPARLEAQLAHTGQNPRDYGRMSYDDPTRLVRSYS
jgi:hypothetical protein